MSRYELCRVKGYDKLSNLQRPAWAEHSRPTSPPRYTFPSLPTSSSSSSLPARDRLSPICRWWRVYAEAHILQRNWAVGVYTAAPLLRGHNQRVACIAHEDDELVSGSCDGSVRVWSMDTLKCLHTLEGHTADVNCVVAKDGVIVTGCADGLVRVFDTRTGQCINSLHGHSGSVEHVVLSGRTLVSAGSDWWAVSETSLIWTPMGQNKVSVLAGVHNGAHNAPGISEVSLFRG
jgi:WD40 repeat protein